MRALDGKRYSGRPSQATIFPATSPSGPGASVSTGTSTWSEPSVRKAPSTTSMCWSTPQGDPCAHTITFTAAPSEPAAFEHCDRRRVVGFDGDQHRRPPGLAGDHGGRGGQSGHRAGGDDDAPRFGRRERPGDPEPAGPGSAATRPPAGNAAARSAAARGAVSGTCSETYNGPTTAEIRSYSTNVLAIGGAPASSRRRRRAGGAARR